MRGVFNVMLMEQGEQLREREGATDQRGERERERERERESKRRETERNRERYR